jgi:hypothetical protein
LKKSFDFNFCLGLEVFKSDDQCWNIETHPGTHMVVPGRQKFCLPFIMYDVFFVQHMGSRVRHAAIEMACVGCSHVPGVPNDIDHFVGVLSAWKQKVIYPAS